MRCFDDAEIIHIEGDVNPTRDLDIISEELRLKDMEFVEKALENQKKKTRMGGQSLEQKKAVQEQATIEKILEYLQSGKDIRKGNWAPKEVDFYLQYSPIPPIPDDKRPNGLNLIPARRMPQINNARAHCEMNSCLITKSLHHLTIEISEMSLD